MSDSISINFILIKKSMDPTRVNNLLDSLGSMPRTLFDPDRCGIETVEDLVSSRPIETVVHSVPILMGGSLNRPENRDDYIELPDDLCRLTIWVGSGSLLELPGQHDNLYEVIKTVFRALDAEYAVSLHNSVLRVEHMPWEVFRTKPGGVHAFSDRLVELVGRGRVSAIAPHHEILKGGGAILRFQEEFFYGMPVEYHEAMRAMLEEIWERASLR